jgi:hypothetical protein
VRRGHVSGAADCAEEAKAACRRRGRTGRRRMRRGRERVRRRLVDWPPRDGSSRGNNRIQGWGARGDGSSVKLGGRGQRRCCPVEAELLSSSDGGAVRRSSVPSRTRRGDIIRFLAQGTVPTDRDSVPYLWLALGKKNREPRTEPKEPGTGTERTGTEKIGS